MYKCGRCDGRGKIRAFGHVAGGVCFACKGSGKTARRPRREKVHGPDPKVVAKHRERKAIVLERFPILADESDPAKGYLLSEATCDDRWGDWEAFVTRAMRDRGIA